MDKESIQLLVLGLFGAFGFILFLVLLALLQRGYIHAAQEQNPGRHNIENSSMKRRSRSLTAERSALIVPSILREFTFPQLEAATGKFGPDNLIKAGHTGDIFRGVMEGGEIAVIKRIRVSTSERDYYQAEMNVYGRVSDQRYLVPLMGQCLEGDEKLLVYQYMPKGDLATALANARASVVADDNYPTHLLPWIVRLKIATGVAKALAYLHHECRPRFAHRNIQASSVLLWENYEIKLGSLSEAERMEGGSLPAYDIYCFGKLLMDLISGLDISGSLDEYAEAWLQRAMPLMKAESRSSLMRLIDPSLVVDEDLQKEVMGVALLGRACMDPETLQNLSMRRVVELIESPHHILCV